MLAELLLGATLAAVVAVGLLLRLFLRKIADDLRAVRTIADEARALRKIAEHVQASLADEVGTVRTVAEHVQALRQGLEKMAPLATEKQSEDLLELAKEMSTSLMRAERLCMAERAGMRLTSDEAFGS